MVALIPGTAAEKTLAESEGRRIRHSVEAHAGRALASFAEFLGILALSWCILFGLYEEFPYVRSGAEIVYQAKTGLLGAGVNANLVIFGNSKVLSGFRPAVFDRMAGLRSYNLGLPDETRFLDNLETLAKAGRPPRFVLLTITRSAPERPASVFRYLDNDRAIIDGIFPFRHFPRDLTLFLLRSRARGGPAAFYRHSESIVAQMEADCGYYFIEAQAQGAEKRLPPGFSLPSDHPSSVNARAPLSEHDVERLNALAARFGTNIWFVPSYFRPGEYATPPGENSELRAMVQSQPRLHLAGPDYWILPLEYFSDASHLNPEGAEAYTARLAELLSPLVK